MSLHAVNRQAAGHQCSEILPPVGQNVFFLFFLLEHGGQYNNSTSK